jgi:adenylate cyclase class 2
MKEIEVKILEVNVPSLVKKIESLGGKKVFEGDISASYFDFPDKRLRAQQKVLRLRQRGKEVELTCKRQTKNETVKMMDEFEVRVTDFNQMKTILNELGLEEEESREDGQSIHLGKHRVSYEVGPIHVELDTIPHFPTFAEIEAHSQEELEEWVKKLGYQMSDAKPWGGRDVINHYRGK